MAEPTEIPLFAPKEALAFFRAKGLARSFAWQDVLRAQHDYWFTVAKMMCRSLLEDVQQILAAGIEEGESPQAMARTLKDRLKAAGWWGKQLQTDPLTGARETVQLGSNRRVRVIVNTNLRTVYGAGRYERIQRNKKLLPIMVYKSRMDGRERPQHRDWHDTALPVDDPWWNTHYPPCDWGCRCRTVSMTKGQAARRGLMVGTAPPSAGTRKWVNKRTGEVFEIEKGIGAGWDYHPGKAKFDGLAPEPLHRFSEEDGEGIASAVAGSVSALLDAFGLDEAGGIFTDAQGWPIAVSPRWLMGLSAEEQARAAVAAVTIAKPDQIREAWVKAKDGRFMLVRRYIRRLGRSLSVVDVNPAFWRFAMMPASKAARLVRGVRAWSRNAA